MIQDWLNKFVKYWETYDIDGVMNLLAEDVIYYENPFKKLKSKDEVEQEWGAIKNQQNIRIDVESVLTEGRRYLAKWELSYENNGVLQQGQGVYIIRLNEIGLCDYFYQVGEKK